MFKTLRRLHGYNLENRGLNDLSETFQNFVTRARFFSSGRLRRTWSHSAVEFLKYRRLLPMLTSDEPLNAIDYGSNVGQSLSASMARERERSSSVERSRNDDRKIFVSNISGRVTANQLKSFFSKFGPITNCHMPLGGCQNSLYATIPRKSRSKLTACITFKNLEDAERAKSAAAEELKFYGRVMMISPLSVNKRYGNLEKTSACSVAVCKSFLDVFTAFKDTNHDSIIPITLG